MLPPLATIDDLESRIGSLSDAQSLRAPALLADASALVRGFTRQDFTLVENDEVVLRPIGTFVRLPQRPILAVSDVRAIGRDGQPADASIGFTWDGADKVRVTGHGIPWLGDPFWPWDTPPRSFHVTYTHGYENVPPDVKAVVANMALRVLTAPTLTEGLVSERIGQYNYQMQQGTGSVGAAVRLTRIDKEALTAAGYKRTAGTVQVTA